MLYCIFSFFCFLFLDVYGSCCLDPAIVIPAGKEPVYVAISPNGNCAVVTNSTDGTITSYSINSNCTITPISTIATDSSPKPAPVFAAFSPSGNCVAVANYGTGTVSSFTIDPLTCQLTKVSTLSSGGTRPYFLAFSSTGCLAVVNISSANVATFSIDQNCALTSQSVTGNIDPANVAEPQFLAFSPDATCLAVPTNGYIGRVAMFSVTNCTLTSSGLFDTSAAPIPPAPPVMALYAAFSPSGKCLAVCNRNIGTVSSFTVNSGCTLSKVSELPSDPSGNSLTQFLGFSQNGNCLISTNPTTDSITTFSVDTGCNLTPIAVTKTDPASTIATPLFFAFSSNGCLVVSNQNGNSISSFNFDQTTCTPTLVSVIKTDPTSVPPKLPHPQYFAVTPNGNCIIVPNPNTNTIASIPFANLSVTISQNHPCNTNFTSLSANISGGAAPYTYSWTGPSGFTSNSQPVIVFQPGTYNVMVTEAGGCSANSSALVTIPANLKVTISQSQSCGSAVLTANVSGGISPYTYSWTGPAGFSSNSQTVKVSASGIYQVIVTDTTGCTAISFTLVTISANLCVTISECPSGCNTTVLTANVTGGLAPYAYKWTGPLGFSSTSPIITAIQPGLYQVTVTDSVGCKANQNIVLRWCN